MTEADPTSPLQAPGAQSPLHESDLQRYRLASPHLIAQRKLQRRVDTKFVLPVRVVCALLARLHGGYALLPAGGRRIATYRTLYFDTERLALFHAHRRGRRLREKVRIRHYPDRRCSFFEIKQRVNGATTTKLRTECTFGDCELDDENRDLASRLTNATEPLVPQVWTDFHRITLVGLRTDERATVDFNLGFRARADTASVDGRAIVEIKQPRFDARTPFMLALRGAGVRPGSASKYCAAIVGTRPDVRHNRLLPSLRRLHGDLS